MSRAHERTEQIGGHLSGRGGPLQGRKALLEKRPDDVVVVSALRTPLCRARKGLLRDTYAEEMLAHVLRGVYEGSGLKDKLERQRSVDGKRASRGLVQSGDSTDDGDEGHQGGVEEIQVGTVLMEMGGAKLARMAALHAGLPVTATLATTNRQCSSGAQACHNIALQIKAGQIKCGIGAGVESMTMHFGAGTVPKIVAPTLRETQNQDAQDCLLPMGVTSENVAQEYRVSRGKQDSWAALSHARAARAQSAGWFGDEILPIETRLKPHGHQHNGSLPSSSSLSDSAAAGHSDSGRDRSVVPQGAVQGNSGAPSGEGPDQGASVQPGPAGEAEEQEDSRANPRLEERVRHEAHEAYTDQEHSFTQADDIVLVAEDDGIRPGTTVEGLARLKPSFTSDRKNGTSTAGNSSQTTDGAAAVLMMRRDYADELGLRPLGKWVDARIVGVPPRIMGVGPAYAIPRLLKDYGLKVSDIDVFEINEAFASQFVWCIRRLGIDPDKVNLFGGAIALGHPLGCTGARVVATLLNTLKHAQGQVGVISMCCGTGFGRRRMDETAPGSNKPGFASLLVRE